MPALFVQAARVTWALACEYNLARGARGRADRLLALVLVLTRDRQRKGDIGQLLPPSSAWPGDMPSHCSGNFSMAAAEERALCVHSRVTRLHTSVSRFACHRARCESCGLLEERHRSRWASRSAKVDEQEAEQDCRHIYSRMRQ